MAETFRALATSTTVSVLRLHRARLLLCPIFWSRAAIFDPSSPITPDEIALLDRYLAGDLAPPDCAKFEAYLMLREPLVDALEQANDERDRVARASGAGNVGSDIAPDQAAA